MPLLQPNEDHNVATFAFARSFARFVGVEQTVDPTRHGPALRSSRDTAGRRHVRSSNEAGHRSTVSAASPAAALLCGCISAHVVVLVNSLLAVAA